MMNTKAQSLFFIYLMMILCGCQPPLSTPVKMQALTTVTPSAEAITETPTKAPAKSTPTPKPTSVIPAAKFEISSPSDLADFSSGVLSPDGKWILRSKTRDERNPFSLELYHDDWPLQLVSISDQLTIITLPYNLKEGKKSQIFEGWAPNGKSFVVAGGDNGEKEPEENKVTVYRIDENNKVIRMTTENTFSTHVYWSSDSSSLLMKDYSGKQVMILDLLSLRPKIIHLDHSLVSFLWKGEKIFATVTTENSQNSSIELRQYDSTFQNYQVLIPAGSLPSVEMIGMDADEKRLLLVDNAYKDKNCTVFVLDVINRKIIKEIHLEGLTIYAGLNSDFSGILDYSAPARSSWTAVRADKPSSKEHRLLMFDWNQLEFYQAGPIQALFGWIEKYNGFVVVKDNQIQVIKPE